MYLPLHLKITENKAKGRIVIAAVPIAKNELVCELFFDSVDFRDDATSVQIWQGLSLHNSLDTIDNLFNHSCNPNTYLKHPQRDFHALRDIASEEEITFHYCTTEYDLIKSKQDFICSCEAVSCLKHIKGFKYLTKAQKQELRPYLSPYLRTLY